MRPNRRQALTRGGALALSFGLAGPAGAASIVAVRLWPAAEYTRVTVESDAPLQTRHFITEAPQRLVIDIEGLELSPALRELVGKVRLDDPFIASLRVGQNQPRVVRLVFDLKQAARPQVFALGPVAAYQHRLVLDLHPEQPVDPLLKLVREKEAAEAAAARTVRDALGEFIGRLPQPVMGSKPASAASGAVAAAASAPSASAPMGPRPAAPAASAALVLPRLVIVALDPGHGGEDPGAIGPSGLREKDVVLAIALQLRQALEQEPHLRVMLTRDADYFVPLHERVRKARRVQADLLVSIHADAFMRPEARGASVFALSDKGASSAAARWLAQKENAADLVGGVNLAVKDEAVVRTLLDMSTTAQIKDSLKLGHEVLYRLGKVGRLHKPRVEQAGFAVLKAPEVPSILVETAFISNPEEEALLREPAYQQQLVEALALGIKRYFARNPPLARSRSL